MPDDRPHILLIMTDQQRADHVGWHPATRLRLPNLDRLAEGHVFANCVTANPLCTPARTALLTGRYSRQIGTLAMSGDLPRGIPTYAQALQRAGYHTAGIGKYHWLQTWKWGAPVGTGVDLTALHAELAGFGFDEVWEATGKQLAQHNLCDWGARLAAKGLLDDYRRHAVERGRNYNTAEETEFTGEPWPFAEEDYADVAIGERALRSLRERPDDRPYFGFFSFCGPHAPYDPPRRFLDLVPEEQDEPYVAEGPDDAPMSAAAVARLRRLRRAYKAMLLCVDEQLGRIFDELERQGMLERTVVLFTTDHGEMMGDHGFFQKSRPQWQASTVPTAIRHPGHLAGTRIESVVELTDLTATILDLAGLEPHRALAKDWPAFNDRLSCRSLLPLVRGESERVRDFAFSECCGRWSMIQTERWKYVRHHDGRDPDAADERLFDLVADPDERIDRSRDPAVAEELASARRRLLWVLERTPPCQTRWAPLTGPDGSDDHPLLGRRGRAVG